MSLKHVSPAEIGEDAKPARISEPGVLARAASRGTSTTMKPATIVLARSSGTLAAAFMATLTASGSSLAEASRSPVSGTVLLGICESGRGVGQQAR